MEGGRDEGEGKEDATNYPLWVGGVQVTSANTSGPGWRYSGDASEGTLTLTGATITDLYMNKNIYSEVEDLTLVLIGSNSLRGGDAFYSEKGNLTITGSGSLEVRDTDFGNYTYAGVLTITNSMVDVSISGYYGISSIGTLEISNSAVSSSANYTALNSLGGLKIDKGLCIKEPEGGQVVGHNIVANGVVANKVILGKHLPQMVQGKPATCTEDGWDTYETCSRCDYSTYVEIPVPATSTTETDPQTITDAGEKDEVGATSYTVYSCLCGKNKSQKLATVTGTSFTWKKLKKGKTFKPDASFKKKGTVKQHRKLSYESTKPKVAKVDKKGKIKAVGVGTCYVYAYTQKGFYKRVKVVVKK